jgi:hypothetical protein
MAPENHKDIPERERTTIDDAREQGIGEANDGVELTVPSYADDGGTSDLGVDEPVVPKPLRGEPSPEQEPEGDEKR